MVLLEYQRIEYQRIERIEYKEYQRMELLEYQSVWGSHCQLDCLQFGVFIVFSEKFHWNFLSKKFFMDRWEMKDK